MGTDQPPGHNPPGQNFPGHNPAGPHPLGPNPGGQAPPGSNPGGQNPLGPNPAGHHPPGPNPPGHNPNFMPTDPRGFPAQAPPRRPGRGGLLVAGLIGLVVGGLLVGGAWLLLGGSGGGSSSPVAAPDRLSDYVQFPDAATKRDPERGKKVAERYRDWDQRSSERLSSANEDAGAVVQTYTNDDLEETFVLEAVRAPSPGPYAAYSDPEVLGLDRPVEELREFGDVGCLLRNDPSQTYVISCARTADDLTVRITHVAGDLLEDPAAVAKLVDTAWDELS